MLVVSWFISGIIFFYLYSYIFAKLVCHEKIDSSFKSLVAALIIGVIYSYLTNFDYNYIRPYIIHVYFIVSLKYIYKTPIIKTVLGVMCTLVLSCLAELLFGLIFILVFKIDFMQTNKDSVMYIISNLMITIIQFSISKISHVRKLIDYIIKWYNENEYKSLVLLMFLCLIIITFLLYNNFISILPPSLLWLTNLFCIGVFVFIIGFFKEKTTKNKIIYEYDQLLDYVKTYENLLEEKSKNQHEYKNQLATIKNFSKNKKIINYINDILKTQDSKIDEEWLEKLKYLPQGGLKGLIYYKIETMINRNLNVYLEVASELNKSKIWKICDQNLNDISKVIGVYLDNAIEASVESKEKYILITVLLENNNIVFEISNTYSNLIDISKVDQSGYTTKGVGKGYGLSLVKDIIDKNEFLVQKRSLNGIYYVQKLYIKK